MQDQDIAEKIEKESDIHISTINKDDLILICSNEILSIVKAGDNGLCSNSSDNLLSFFGVSTSSTTQLRHLVPQIIEIRYVSPCHLTGPDQIYQS